MSDPRPTGIVASVCTDLMTALPSTVLDEDRREVQPGQFSAAWGDPTITLRCGGPPPPTLTEASQCFEVNGVGWFAEQGSGGYLFTTIGRSAFVEIGVPSSYAPEANALVDVAAAITAQVPVLSPCV